MVTIKTGSLLKSMDGVKNVSVTGREKVEFNLDVPLATERLHVQLENLSA